MPITSVTQRSTSFSHEKENSQPKYGLIGTIHSIQDAFPAKVSPCYLRGAMQGEGVISSYNSRMDDNYLYSLNAQSCVIATLYNEDNRNGAIIHFDHNISHLIDEAIDNTILQLKADGNGAITSTLSGGIWFMSGESIGGPVKNSLIKNNINPPWDYWSTFPCMNRNYGVVLSLEDGKVDVFEHSMSLASEFYSPLLRETRDAKNDNPVHKRARAFMTRFKQPPITESNNGLKFIDPHINKKITDNDINQFRFHIHDII